MIDILSIFANTKPVVGVIHSRGDSPEDAAALAEKEIKAYYENGLDGILVETYFGNYHNAAAILELLRRKKLPVPYGINCLNIDAMTFEMANDYGCAFMQIDSVVGHVKPRDEASLGEFFRRFRARTGAALMGGVRFKYQPVLSENTLEEDLHIAMDRCDCICVTQDATGQETSPERIRTFKDVIGAFPLFVCAGVTPDNVTEQLGIADGAVVGSYFKDNYRDTGIVCGGHVKEIMDRVRMLRQAAQPQYSRTVSERL